MGSHLFAARGHDRSETIYPLLSMELVGQKQCIGNTRPINLPRSIFMIGFDLPQDFAGTFAVACKLSRDGNKSHLPFQNPAAFS